MENTKLYVGNLPFATTAQDLEGLLGQAGAVSVVEIVFDKFTGRSRGFAFATLCSENELAQALVDLSDADFMGRPLRVSVALDKKRNGGARGRQQRRDGDRGRPGRASRDRRGGGQSYGWEDV